MLPLCQVNATPTFVMTSDNHSRFPQSSSPRIYQFKLKITVCPRISDPFYIVSYYVKWVTTSWTHGTCLPLPTHTVHIPERKRKKREMNPIHAWKRDGFGGGWRLLFPFNGHGRWWFRFKRSIQGYICMTYVCIYVCKHVNKQRSML